MRSRPILRDLEATALMQISANPYANASKSPVILATHTFGPRGLKSIRNPKTDLTLAPVTVRDVQLGVVQAVRGAVVDVVFEGDDLPSLNSALVVVWGGPKPLILEFHSDLDLTTLRAVEFQSAMRCLGGCWMSWGIRGIEAMTEASRQIMREMETFQAMLRPARQEAITAEIIELGSGDCHRPRRKVTTATEIGPPCKNHQP